MKSQNRRIARAAAGLLAVALCAVPVLEAAHEARVGHFACPEDGELVDAPAQARHEHAQEAAEGAQFFRERDPAAPIGSGAEHQHCIVALRSHLRAREEKSLQLSVPYQLAVVSTAAASLPVPLSSIALYRLAPKSGPPQA